MPLCLKNTIATLKMLASDTLYDFSPENYVTGYVLDNHWHLVNIIHRSRRKPNLISTRFVDDDFTVDDGYIYRRMEATINDLSKMVEEYHNDFEGNALKVGKH